MRNLALFLLLILTITIYSCGSDSPTQTEPANTIFNKSGIVDSVKILTSGNTSQSMNFFTDAYDFSSLDSIRVQFTYTKTGSDSTPVSIYYLNNMVPTYLYSVIDTQKSTHSVIINSRIPSPKKSATLGYTLRATKNSSDSLGFCSLKDVTITRK